jgi:hypothetical protein
MGGHTAVDMAVMCVQGTMVQIGVCLAARARWPGSTTQAADLATIRTRKQSLHPSTHQAMIPLLPHGLHTSHTLRSVASAIVLPGKPRTLAVLWRVSWASG